MVPTQPVVGGIPSCGLRSEEVPFVPCKVKEHGNSAVGLIARFRDKLDAVVEHPPPSRLEVVDPKEQADSACVLASDSVNLVLAVCCGQEQPGLCPRRFDDDPTLRTSIVRRCRRVLDQVESQCVDEEPDGAVVVLDDQRCVLDVHTRRRYMADCLAAAVSGAGTPMALQQPAFRRDFWAPSKCRSRAPPQRTPTDPAVR
jgi:hypothetical protein